MAEPQVSDERMNRFVSSGNTFYIPICNGCLYYDDDGLCDAFPDGIPMEILSGEVGHDTPLEGQDNDFVFTKEPE